MNLKTHREIQQFLIVAHDWSARHPERSKLSYALARTSKRLQPALVAYQEALEDARVEHCLTGERDGTKDVMLIDGERYQFDKPGMRRFNETARRLAAQEIEVEPFYVTDIPDDLTDWELSAFEGFVIDPTSEQAG